MTLLKYQEVDIDAETVWEENLPHTAVIVRGGYVEVADNADLTIESLLWRGYAIVEVPADDEAGDGPFIGPMLPQ